MDIDNSQLSLQAHIFIYVGLIVGITILIMVPKLWLLGITIIIGTFMGAYSINCMINGECKLWAWSVLTVNIAYMIIFLTIILRSRGTRIFKKAK